MSTMDCPYIQCGHREYWEMNFCLSFNMLGRQDDLTFKSENCHWFQQKWKCAIHPTQFQLYTRARKTPCVTKGFIFCTTQAICDLQYTKWGAISNYTNKHRNEQSHTFIRLLLVLYVNKLPAPTCKPHYMSTWLQLSELQHLAPTRVFCYFL